MRCLGHRAAPLAWLLAFTLSGLPGRSQDPGDVEHARELFRQQRRGEMLSNEEREALRRAMPMRAGGTWDAGRAAVTPRASTGLTPLCDRTPPAADPAERGLYGNGANGPPETLRPWMEAALKLCVPRDRDGIPSPDGQLVLTAFSMSNAFQEFERFRASAMASPRRARAVQVVNTAQGGQAMAEWADVNARPWIVADQRLAQAGCTPAQVQAAWVKVANKGRGESLDAYSRRLEDDTVRVLQSALHRYPNLRIVYFGSRIYGGYAVTPLNPEPYAHESGRVVRRILLRQASGDPALNPDPTRGEVKAPLLLWGPYLWADGEQGRSCDDLVWTREDFVNDGTHPSASGCNKVAQRLLEFFLNDPAAAPWFAKRDPL